ncbi:MAG TPA: hypothetical protein VH951_08940 [Dehalococcoidia bacterium]|jgi:hypothetical protein
MPVFLLFTSMLMFMFMRVYLPFGAHATGKVQKVVSLNFMERMLLQRFNVYALGAVLILCLTAGVLPAAWQLPIVVLAFAALSLRVRYFVTSAGIGMNNVFFRPWDEFEGYRVERRRVVLVATKGLRNLAIPVIASHQKELTTAIGRHLHPLLQQEGRRADQTAGAS